MSNTAPPSLLVAHAEQALAAGDIDSAQAITDHILKPFGRHGRAHLLRALLAEKTGDTDSALSDLKFVTSVDPSNAQARAAQARIFSARGDEARARELANMTVELIPNDLSTLESVLEILGVDADALPPTPGVIARVYLATGWPALAERHSRNAIEEAPQRVDIRLTLAEALWREDRLTACEDQCKVIFDQANDCVRAAVMRAHILSEHGRTAEGQDLLSRVGEIDPEFIEARQMLGLLEVHRLLIPETPELPLPEAMLQTANALPPHTPESPLAAPGDEETAGPGDSHPPESDVKDSVAKGGDATTDTGRTVSDEPDTQIDMEMDPAEFAGKMNHIGQGQLSFPTNNIQPPGTESISVSRQPFEENEDVLPGTPSQVGEEVKEGPTNSDSPPTSRSEAVGPQISKLDWAQELLEQDRWNEAETLIDEMVQESQDPAPQLEALIMGAVGTVPNPVGFWKLLGDLHMRLGDPKAAAEAYVQAERTRQIINE